MSVDDLYQGVSFTPLKIYEFIRWQSPNPGRVKLNFDGSLQNNSAAGGFILRDWRRAALLTGAANYGSTLILVVDGHALRDGLQATVAAGYKRLDIEGDNLILIEAIQGKSTIPWQIKFIIHDIHTMLSQIDQVQVNHIFREANMAADWLSKYSHSITGTILGVDCGNIALRNVVHDDMLGRTLVRRGV